MERNEGKHKASYFTSIEQEILMSAYAEYEIIFRHKSNSAANKGCQLGQIKLNKKV